ncbi:unnamed protein product, partial [marine sediment metagenome]
MIQAYTDALCFGAWEEEIKTKKEEAIKNKVPHYDREFNSWENE